MTVQKLNVIQNTILRRNKMKGILEKTIFEYIVNKEIEVVVNCGFTGDGATIYKIVFDDGFETFLEIKESEGR